MQPATESTPGGGEIGRTLLIIPAEMAGETERRAGAAGGRVLRLASYTTPADCSWAW